MGSRGSRPSLPLHPEKGYNCADGQKVAAKCSKCSFAKDGCNSRKRYGGLSDKINGLYAATELFLSFCSCFLGHADAVPVAIAQEKNENREADNRAHQSHE